MKVWLKLLIGSILGMALGFLLPENNQSILNILAVLQEGALQIGRYMAVPILFFSLIVAIYELREDGCLWPLLLRTGLVMAACTALVIVAGVLATLAFPPGRIPIIIEEEGEPVSFLVHRGFFDLFPTNMFAVLTGDGSYLAPLYIFTFFLGLGLAHDRVYSKPVVALIDSLSRIFYYIASFFSEILGFSIIIFSAYWAVRFRGIVRAEIFRDLNLFLAVFSAILALGILPCCLYLLKKPRVNPWVQLYGSLGPALTAFFSGDITFTIPVLIRHVKENLGARRRANAVTLALFTCFCRAGSAMVAASAFIVILKSYSSLAVTLPDVIVIILRAMLLSFMLARHPGDAVYTTLAVLCLGYGRGFEAGYLILKPLAFYLAAVGAFLDVMIAALASSALSRLSGFQDPRSMRQFI